MERQMSRRNSLKTSVIALGTVAVSGFQGTGSAVAAGQNQSQVFFTEDISVD